MDLEAKAHSIIRRAEPTLADARALLDVERASLADSSYTAEEALATIERPECYAYLALVDAQPVGFCSCLETPLAGQRRLEIDLLGVRPEFRSRGIATDLIRHSVSQGRLRGRCSFRGVVAHSNMASQRAFRKAGFTTSRRVMMLVYELESPRAPDAGVDMPSRWSHQIQAEGSFTHAGRVWDARGEGHEVHILRNEAGQVVALAEALEVQTLSYAGLWIERLAAQDDASSRAIGDVLAKRGRSLDCDEVGYLSPIGEQERRIQSVLTQQGYDDVGTYLVLTR